MAAFWDLLESLARGSTVSLGSVFAVRHRLAAAHRDGARLDMSIPNRLHRHMAQIVALEASIEETLTQLSQRASDHPDVAALLRSFCEMSAALWPTSGYIMGTSSWQLMAWNSSRIPHCKAPSGGINQERPSNYGSAAFQASLRRSQSFAHRAG